jgi:hypothetical protein
MDKLHWMKRNIIVALCHIDAAAAAAEKIDTTAHRRPSKIVSRRLFTRRLTGQVLS